jgi:hypothetical protein
VEAAVKRAALISGALALGIVALGSCGAEAWPRFGNWRTGQSSSNGSGVCAQFTKTDRQGNWWCLQGSGSMAPGSKVKLSSHGSPNIIDFKGAAQIQLNPTDVSQDQYYATPTQAPPAGAFTVCVLGTKTRLNTVDWFAFGDHSSVSHVLAEDNGTSITAYDFSSTKTRPSNVQFQESLVCEAFTPSTEIKICAWGGDQSGALGGCNHQSVTNPTVTSGNLKWTIGAAETGTAYNMGGYVRGALFTEQVLSDAELLRIANATLRVSPPAGWAFWLSGTNIDGAGNNGISNDQPITSWSSAPATSVADFAAVAAAVTDGGQPHAVTSGENSVAFTGVYNQVVSPNSGHILNSVNSTGVFDLFLKVRRRNTTINGERRITGDSEGQAGLFVGLNAYNSGGPAGEGSLWVILGNGSSLLSNYRATTSLPLGQVTSVLIRGDGSNLKIATPPFSSFAETSAFVASPGGTDAGYDWAVGAINPADVVGQQFFEGDDFEELLYTGGNLNSTQLSTMASFLSSGAGPTQRVWAALGDSLTEGATMAYPWPARVTAALRPTVAVANQGKSGDTCAGASTRYTNVIHGQSFVGTIIAIDTNDLAAGTSAATIYSCTSTLVAAAKADGPVVLATVPPTNGFAGWTGAMQTQWTTLNASIRTTDGVTVWDRAVNLADPNDSTKINPLYDYGDHRHENDAGGARDAADLIAMGVIR